MIMNSKNLLEETYDVAVVGAGHAGCEAALACARLGLETIIFTVSLDSIALMPCNPNIGGSSKGHLVREIDALGGQMGINIDKTFIQSKMLNQSKGPAVHSLRAQADKEQYSRTMRRVLENQENLDVRQTEVVNILTEEVCESGKKKVIGVQILSGGIYRVKAVVLCTGTYLRARCVYGEVSNATGPNGLQAANHLTECLKNLGINMYRFKTGTPARIDKRSIDFSKMEAQYGDERITPFSFTTNPDDIQIDQVPCWLTYTNEKTHEIIRNNLDRSPLYSGMIEGTGPRYCPSIEDKVVRFADKNRHQVFIEPEGIDTNEMYIGGMSSSLPEDVQYDMYRSVAGLEHAKIVRNAYAIEYDCIDARQLKPSLEFREIEGLFSGGQFNGSSGYEEAACQGLIAGINAARKLQKKEAVVLDRSQAYIGVLIDDLVTKENHEPYRMMTSRAEYRLLLRQDNADQRLTEIGYEIGLISQDRYERLKLKEKLIEEIDQLDPDDRHYRHRKSDLDERLFRMYDKIDESEDLLIEAKAKKQSIEADKVTTQNIIAILTNFEHLYSVMNDVEKHELMAELIADIQIYPERQPNGQWLKSIHFQLPIIPEKELQFGLDNSGGFETVICFSKGTYPHRSVKVEFPLEGLNVAQLQGSATYEQIKAYVLEHSGLKVSPLYIAQVKQKYRIIERECYNKPKSEDAKQPQCPPDKETAIVEALKFYGLIAP